MKKLFSLILASTIGLATMATATAQVPLKSQYGNVVDTVVDAGTKYLTSGRITGYADVALVSVELDRISGTMGGTVSLEASTNGVRWYPYFVGRDSSYTYAPANAATGDFRFRLERVRDIFFRVKYTGASTMSVKIRSNIVK